MKEFYTMMNLCRKMNKYIKAYGYFVELTIVCDAVLIDIIDGYRESIGFINPFNHEYYLKRNALPNERIEEMITKCLGDK